MTGQLQSLDRYRQFDQYALFNQAIESKKLINSKESDQLFFSTMAGLFLLVAIIGFLPNSAAILNGSKSNPPYYVHLHAAVMFAWVSVLFVQTIFVARDRGDLHRKFGVYSILLAILVLGTMVQMAIANYPGGEFGPFVLVLQARRISLFSLFVLIALLMRHSHSAAHRRLLLLATLVPLDAAFNRMSWLPDFDIERTVVTIKLYEILLVLPLWIHDFRTLGRPHMATILGTVCLALFGAALVFLAWDFPTSS